MRGSLRQGEIGNRRTAELCRLIGPGPNVFANAAGAAVVVRCRPWLSADDTYVFSLALFSAPPFSAQRSVGGVQRSASDANKSE